MQNMKDKKQLSQELRKQNNVQSKPKYFKPTYEKDEEMDKIFETIGILNVNWEDVRACKDVNRSILVSSSIVNDSTYTEAGIDYAAALIASNSKGAMIKQHL